MRKKGESSQAHRERCMKNLEGWSGRKGVANPIWKGDAVGYRALHCWVIREKGIAIQCEKCMKMKTTPKSIQWANKSHEYRRDIGDWISLCVPCHRQHDMTPELKRKLVLNFHNKL